MLAAMNASGQWVPMNNGIQNNNNAITLSALGNIIFAGTYNFIHSQGFVYRSTNNGINWVETNLYTHVYSFTVLGSNYFAGTNGYGVYISANNGLNWSQSGLNSKSVRSLTVLGSQLFAGTSDSGVFLSSNNGTSWTRTSLNNQNVYSLKTLGSNIFAGTVNNGVYITTNNGTNWTQTALNNKTVISLAVSGNNIYASISDTGGIYRSINNGTSWTRAPLYNKHIESITADGNNIFATTVNVSNSGGIYVSTNNGVNWYIKNEGFSYIPSSIYTLAILNNYAFVGTSRDTSVWRRPISEIVGVQNISTEVPSVYSLSQNYPNPFNPTTKIRFYIPRWRGEGGWTTLRVYDVMGREVQTLVNETLQAGTYEATFNIESATEHRRTFGNGVYFYKLTTDGFTETKKMTLIK